MSRLLERRNFISLNVTLPLLVLFLLSTSNPLFAQSSNSEHSCSSLVKIEHLAGSVYYPPAEETSIQTLAHGADGDFVAQGSPAASWTDADGTSRQTSGYVTVMDRQEDGSWEQALIFPPGDELENNLYFGNALDYYKDAASGEETLLIGAKGKDPTNEGGGLTTNCGAVYIYARAPGASEFSHVQSLYGGCHGNEWPHVAFRFGTKVKFDRANPDQFAVSAPTDNLLNSSTTHLHGSISVYTKAEGSSTWDLSTTVYPDNPQTNWIKVDNFDFHNNKLLFTRHADLGHPIAFDVFDTASDTLESIDIPLPEDLSDYPRQFDPFFLEGTDLIVVGEKTYNDNAGGVHIYRDEIDGSFTQLGTVEAEPDITEYSTNYFGDHLLVAENSFIVLLASHMQRFKVDVENGTVGSFSDISYSDAIFHRPSPVTGDHLFHNRVVSGNFFAKSNRKYVEVIDLEKLSNPVRLESVSNPDFKLNCREPIPLIETAPRITIDEEYEEYILSSAADKFLGYTDLTGTVYDPLTDWCQQQSDCSVGTIVPEMTINDHVVTLTLNGNPGEYNFTHTQHPVHMGENNLMSVRVKNGAGYADRVRVLYSLEYPVEHYFQPQANPNDILLAYDDSTKEKPKDVTPFKVAVESEEPELTMRATRRELEFYRPGNTWSATYYDLISNVRIALEDPSLAGTQLSARLVLRDSEGGNPRYTTVVLNEYETGKFRQIGTLLLGHFPGDGYLTGGDFGLPDDERLSAMTNRALEYPSLLYIDTGGTVEINIVPSEEAGNHNPTILHKSTLDSRGIASNMKESEIINLFELSPPSPKLVFETSGMAQASDCGVALENPYDGTSTDISEWLTKDEETGKFTLEGAPPFPEGAWRAELTCSVPSSLPDTSDLFFRNVVHGFSGDESSAMSLPGPSNEPLLGVMTDEEAMDLAYHLEAVILTIPNEWGVNNIQYFLHVMGAEMLDIRLRPFDNVRWLITRAHPREGMTAKQLLERMEEFGVDKLPVYGHTMIAGLTFPKPEAADVSLYDNFGLFVLGVKIGIDRAVKELMLSPLALVPPENVQMNLAVYGAAIAVFGAETEQLEEIGARLGAFHEYVDTLYANPFEEHERSYLDVVEVLVTDGVEQFANLPKTSAVRLGRAHLDGNLGEEIGELFVEVGTMDLGMRLPGIPGGSTVLRFPPHSLGYQIIPQWGRGLVALETIREVSFPDAPGVGVIPPGLPIVVMMAGGDDDVPDEPSPDGEHGPKKRVYDDEHYLTNPEWFDSPLFDATPLNELTDRPHFGDVTVVRGERLPDGTHAPGKVYASGGNEYYSSIGSHDSDLTWNELMFLGGGDLSDIQTIDVPTTYRADQIATFDSPLFRWEINSGELPFGIKTGRQARLYRKPKNPPVENPTIEDYDYFYSEWQGGEVPGANGRFGHAWFPEWFETSLAYDAADVYTTMPLQQFVDLGGKFFVNKVGRLHRRILHPVFDPDTGDIIGQVPMRIITEIDLLTSKPILYDIRPDLGLDLP